MIESSNENILNQVIRTRPNVISFCCDDDYLLPFKTRTKI